MGDADALAAGFAGVLPAAGFAAGLVVVLTVGFAGAAGFVAGVRGVPRRAAI